MRLVQNMRTYVTTLLGLAAVAMAGCSDSPNVAPSAGTAVHAPANFAQIGKSVTFRVSNSQGITQQIGEHILYMEAGAICELTSSYGPTTWDSDCRPLKGWVTITATVFSGPNGESYVDFQPAMRFAPRKQAYLFLRATRASAETQMNRLLVKYCNNLGYCADESIVDASLKPFRVDEYGVVGRRVKHFSGYVLTYESCPAGETCGFDGLARRSGYMVASGERDVVEELKNSGVFDRDDE